MGFPNPRWTCPKKFAQPKKKIPKPALHTLLPWHNHHFTFVEQSCVKWTKVKKAGRRLNEFWGGFRGDFFFVFSPLFWVRSVTTQVGNESGESHESGMSIACTFSFYRLVHQFMGNRAWHCSSVLAQRGPRDGGGASTLGSLGPSQLLGKGLQSTTPKRFSKKS
jgi:hypothetical protein